MKKLVNLKVSKQKFNSIKNKAFSFENNKFKKVRETIKIRQYEKFYKFMDGRGA